MPHVITATYQANPNIGLFCYANDRYCLVPHGMSDNQKKKFEEVLKVPVHDVSAAGTNLLGVFFAGNENCLLIPEIMFESELKRLQELKIDYKIVKSELTALGNNLIVSKNMCIANPEYHDSLIKEIEHCLKIPVKKGKINELDTVGSLAKGNSRGILVGSDIKDFEKKFLKDNLKINITTGTVNFGSHYVSSGIVCNSNGFIIGEASGGPEIQNADEAFGFIE